MAEFYRVNIAFTPRSNKLLTIPELVRVPQFTVVQWNLVFVDVDLIDRRFFGSGLVFTLYFQGESAFNWRRQFVQLHVNPFFLKYPPNIARLAEDVAATKGDFKYGVSVVEAESAETLYDEDPRLIVF